MSAFKCMGLCVCVCGVCGACNVQRAFERLWTVALEGHIWFIEPNWTFYSTETRASHSHGTFVRMDDFIEFSAHRILAFKFMPIAVVFNFACILMAISYRIHLLYSPSPSHCACCCRYYWVHKYFVSIWKWITFPYIPCNKSLFVMALHKMHTKPNSADWPCLVSNMNVCIESTKQNKKKIEDKILLCAVCTSDWTMWLCVLCLFWHTHNKCMSEYRMGNMQTNNNCDRLLITKH